MRTLQVLLEQDRPVRGARVHVVDTTFVATVAYVDGDNNVYLQRPSLTEWSGPYRPQDLILVEALPRLVGA